MEIFNEHTIVIAEINEKGELEVIRKFPSYQMFLTDPPRQFPSKVIKYIYGAVDGKVELIREIIGRHTPSSMIHETIKFDDYGG